MSFSAQRLAALARLAQLDLQTAQLEQLSPQLTQILDHLTLLEVPSAPPAHDPPSVWRADEVKPSLPVAQVRALFPARLEDFLQVPAVRPT